jgi:hypothetical protein
MPSKCEGCGAEEYTQVRGLYELMNKLDNPFCPKCIEAMDKMSEENDKDWAYELDWDGGDE